jgi:hypothetical protein
MFYENNKKKVSCNSVLYLKKVRELKEMEVSIIKGKIEKSEYDEIVK